MKVSHVRLTTGLVELVVKVSNTEVGILMKNPRMSAKDLISAFDKLSSFQ